MKCDYTPAQLRRRVTLQSVSQTSDGQGGFTETWADVCDLWASIEPAKGYERFQAMQVQTPITHRVMVRYRSDISTADRLLYGARVFAIKEVINLEEMNIYLRLLCVETT